MTMYEVDLRDRRTGNSVECIYSGDDHSKAYEIAENWNKKNLNDYDEDMCADDYIDGSNGFVADVYHVEHESQLQGVGKF